ncbi:MAG TPA: phosphonate C-P lyase system protein PhnH [Candidatus Elarobacter sp.]|jgi:alpha-D-ribose 1-methylphosphonate 5-triphosphate synthase subunit PhnH|nr:phosphonate C-P lyase system protein PhnH [Candidatus Elarobacter sp.]
MPLAFADPVEASQTVFRALLDAMARPGRIVDLPSPAIEAIALTLFDADVTVWTAPADPRRDWLRARCGCRVVDHPADAAYAVVSALSSLPPLDAFELGTPVEPERSTTIVLGVASLRGGRAAVLHGPGIDGTVKVTPRVPPSFWTRWSENARRSPLGVDVILVDDGGALALPRSAQVLA